MPILWQDVSCNMCSRKSSLAIDTVHMDRTGSSGWSFAQMHSTEQKTRTYTEARARTEQSFHRSSHPNADFGIPGSAEAHVNTQPSNTGTQQRGRQRLALSTRGARTPCHGAFRHPWISRGQAARRYSPAYHELQHRFESTLNSIIYPACMLDPHRGPATHVHATRTCTRPRSRKSDLRETGTKHEKHRPT